VLITETLRLFIFSWHPTNSVETLEDCLCA